MPKLPSSYSSQRATFYWGYDYTFGESLTRFILLILALLTGFVSGSLVEEHPPMEAPSMQHFGKVREESHFLALIITLITSTLPQNP